MKTNYVFIKLMAVVILLLTGCNNSNTTLTPNEISDSLEISYQVGPEIQIYSYVQALVKNPTTYCIVFPLDYGMKIYSEENGNNVEIKNRTVYIGDKPNYLKAISDIESFVLVVISPDTSQLIINQPINFYAEITGHLCDDESVVIKKQIPFVVVP